MRLSLLDMESDGTTVTRICYLFIANDQAIIEFLE
jgi:hypothetical protein